LRIEEIPPLDVFYILARKTIVKIKRKKRNLDSTTATTPDNEPIDIVWKDSPIDPFENFTRLSKFARAYATLTINKAIEL